MTTARGVARTYVHPGVSPDEVRCWYALGLTAEANRRRGGHRAARTERWHARCVEREWRAAMLYIARTDRLCDPALYSRPTGPGRLP